MMSINQAKLIKKYVSFKKNPFDIKHKCLGDAKLNKQLIHWSETKNISHGRNLFLFNPYFQSLSTIDHLILTPNGLVLIDFIEPVKDIQPFDEDWWVKGKNHDLIPNYFREMKRKKEQLKFYLQLHLSIQVPIYELIVSKTDFMEGIYTYETIISHLESIKSPNLLTEEQLQGIQSFILTLHQKTIETKIDCFEPQMWLNHYCPLGSYQDQLPEHRLYKKLNHFLYDNLSEAVILSRYRIPIDGVQLPLMDYLIVSKKGGLVINQLTGGGKIKESSDQTYWIQEYPATNKQPETKNKISNPILVSQQQARGLTKIVHADLIIAYSVFGLSPIDLEVNHAALALDLNLEHNLDRYIKQHPDTLSMNQFYQLLVRLKH